MDGHPNDQSGPTPVWFDANAGDFETFKALVATETDLAAWPHAADLRQNVLVYDGAAVQSAARDPKARRALTAEWARVFADGPGIIVIKDALPEAVVARATEIFSAVIEAEKAAGGGGGDHFAKPGANDRVWNALQKHCLADPENFARYYGADALALASEAWLGPGYQMTAQVNRVNPGGAAQTPHRDYHLGFMSPEQAAAFPAQVHGISPLLTLQGAVAHCDMPVESGPTVYLPYSQKFFEGYIAFSRPEFQDHFARHHVQLPLARGDAVFFNPAMMHGAGENRSAEIYRMANLLQVSSALGRATEAVDRIAMVKALYPVLHGGDFTPAEIQNAVAASAEGYAFPTNLDRDPPVGGLAPPTQAAQMLAALAAGTSPEAFAAEIDAWAARRTA